MNSFWDFVDWILPPVRIVDDLTDYPSEPAHRSRSNHHQSSGTTRRLSGKDHDKERERETGRRREKDRDRERERERHGDRERERPTERERERTRERGRETPRRGPEQDREREQLRQRIQQLERENDSLQSQLRTTREELSTLSAAVFVPTSPSERTPPPHPFTYATTSPDPALIALPPSRAHSRASSEASTSRTPVATQVAQYSAEAALADPRRLRVLYSALRATYGDARQTILAQAEELASLKSFLSKTDEWSGAQLLQALADLNSEIIQLSASVAEEFAAALRIDARAPGAAKKRDRQIVEPALGKEMLELLEKREHAEDPTLVQFALQAWEVWCVSRVMEAFCYGLPAEVDEALKLLFERMQREEPQPTTARWRALTYKHARSLIARSRQSSEPASPDTAAPGPSPFNSAPASIVSTTSLPPPLLTLTEANLRGILAILALAGCTDARGLHRDPLRALYGSALSRISARAERISTVVKEGVLSGLFDVVWVPPCQSPNPSTSSTRRAGSATPHVNGVGANRGKGTEAEWVKEVERAQADIDDKPQPEEQPGDQERQKADRWFDWGAMENVYAGHCDEHCRVLCTVELGLAFSRRVPEEEGDGEESVDGDGMVVSGSGSRPTSSASRLGSMGGGGVGLNGGSASRNTSMHGEAAGEGASEGGRLVRTLLLKPKVLLESVVDIL